MNAPLTVNDKWNGPADGSETPWLGFWEAPGVCILNPVATIAMNLSLSPVLTILKELDNIVRLEFKK